MRTRPRGHFASTPREEKKDHSSKIVFDAEIAGF